MQIDLLVRASLLASVGAVALAAAPAFAAEQDAPAAADEIGRAHV